MGKRMVYDGKADSPRERGAHRVSRTLALWVAVGLLALQPGTGQTAGAAYGEQYVRLGQVWADGRPGGERQGAGGDQREAAGTPPAERAAYGQLIESLEVDEGPYAAALAEPLTGLARHFRDQGDFEQAERLYQRALHVVRVNDGLTHTRQLPLVRELLDTYRAAGDMQKLDDRYDYFFRLYGQGRPPFTETRLRAAVEYLRWQREALRSDFARDDNRRLLSLYTLNEELLEAVELDAGVDYTWYRQLVLSQVRNLYLVQARIAPKIEEIGLVHYNPMASPGTGMFGAENFEETRLETIQRNVVARGATLLETLIDRAAPEGVVAQGNARLELADWYQWNGSTTRARGLYAEVAASLSEAGEYRLLDFWLGSPVELPDNGAFWQPRRLAEKEQRVALVARFDVTASGRARQVAALADKEADESAARRLRREISDTVFRPRFRSGVAEAVSNLEVTYEVMD